MLPLEEPREDAALQPANDGATLASERVEGDGYVYVRLSATAAKNLERLLQKPPMAPTTILIQMVAAAAALVFTFTGVQAISGAAAAAIGGHAKPALLLLIWGGLALFSGAAASAQQLTIITAIGRRA